MKTHITALDLHYLVQEFQSLVGAKVEKAWQKLREEKKEVLFQLHVPSKGKQFLKCKLPEIVYLTDVKDKFPILPPGFAMFLRKRLNKTRITHVQQIDFERIIEIGFETKETEYRLIVELIPPGNMILCEKDYTIINPLENQKWKDRKIQKGEQYKFPKSEVNTLTVSEEEFNSLIDNAKRDNIVKVLAIDFSLGGVYAEYICKEAKIDKNKKSLTDAEKRGLFKALQTLITHNIKANITEGEILPIELNKPDKSFDSFNAAINSVFRETVEKAEIISEEAAHKKKLTKVEKVIQKQTYQAEGMSKSALENQKKGELIYEYYQALKDIIEDINKVRKEYGWHAVKEKYKGHKIVKDVNRKEGKIVVELD